MYNFQSRYKIRTRFATCQQKFVQQRGFVSLNVLFMFELVLHILDKNYRDLQTGLFRCVQGNKSGLGFLHFDEQHTAQTQKKPSPIYLKAESKIEKQNNRCCKALCANTQMQRFAKIFENICILIKFIHTEHLPD